MKVSLITTVFNEAGSIERLLGSLANQSRRPDEIVIVDGGSSDGTPDLIAAFAKTHPDLPIQLIVGPGDNISAGRNRAIAAASHPIIAATDAGTRLPADWLQNLVAPFEQDARTAVVAGFFRADPDPTSPFEIAMGATVLPVERNISPEKFLPSSRSVAFTKTAWQTAGGYPEWLDYCEDLIFDLALKQAGYNFVWQPQALALFRPRSTLWDFWKQYYRYARGDGKAGLFARRHILRYGVYLVGAPVGVALAGRWPILWPVVLGAGGGYVAKVYERLFKDSQPFRQLTPSKKLAAILYVPVIRAVGDIAKMVGYPVGLVWRRQNLSRLPQNQAVTS